MDARPPRTASYEGRDPLRATADSYDGPRALVGAPVMWVLSPHPIRTIQGRMTTHPNKERR
ncbi:hypothetical protein GCM10022255_110110 [Dactylosporangium darangshiense]|uniref:Uncharacterized protein n=1 Tax=Dactylosporangium darangshiense TaxID=579108 RepID=A0ABP8DUG2_9ACTN